MPRPPRRLRLRAPARCLVAWSLLGRALADRPQLEVMYMKFDQEPIDLTPVFDPMVDAYQATLDWKMKYFSVQALPKAPGVIDNIHLCVQDADCLKQQQNIVVLDFSRPIPVQPGTKVLFEFDVLLEGVVRSYKIIVHRLSGSEVDIRHMVAQGCTLYPEADKETGMQEKPEFQSHIPKYRSFLDMTMETATMELHLRDASQTIFASASIPEPIGPTDTIMKLRNDHKGSMRSQPTRRLREEAFGEFQYPNKYVEFAVPLGHKRTVSFEVISADGMKRGFYTLELGRGECPEESPLFDTVESECVRFCNTGFWADHKANRCKACQDTCSSCLGPKQCIRCPEPVGDNDYFLDNVTGTCKLKVAPIWEKHPQHAIAIGIAIFSGLTFFIGLCAFRSMQAKSMRERKAMTTVGAHHEHVHHHGSGGHHTNHAHEHHDHKLGGHGKIAPNIAAKAASALEAFRGGSKDGYMKVSMEDNF